jgi:hypothetical protein
MNADPSLVAAAIASGKPPQCPRFRGYWVFSESTERAYPQRCNRWDCSYCSRFKSAAARIALARGVERAFTGGKRVRFITLTDASGAMDVEDWTRAWKRLSLRLGSPRKGRKVRRNGRTIWKERPRPVYVEAAAVAIEAHASGALHMHALLVGEYIPQAWLSRQAREVGLGRITDIRALDPQANSGGIADYLVPGGTAWEGSLETMTAAAYLTAGKHGLGAVAERSKKRVRPLRFSRSWPSRPGPGGALTKAEEDLIAHLFEGQDRDPGEFELWQEAQLWEEIRAVRERRAGGGAMPVPWEASER